MRLSVKEVEEVAFKLAQQQLTFNEPIPDFSSRYPNVLESCLIVPFQSFDRQSLYKGLVSKAAILLYLMVKNHPFQNGNKRIALVTLLYFLRKNNKWLKVDQNKLYNFLVWIASSPAELQEYVVMASEKFIRTHLIDKS